MVFKEEALGEILYSFFKFLISQKRLNIKPLLIFKYLTAKEFQQWLKNQLTDSQIIKKIVLRKKQGFIYLDLHKSDQEIIDRPTEIEAIRNYFLKLNQSSSPKNNQLIGQIAFGSDKIIKGKVIIIKDKSELKTKKSLIKNKILVAIQTSPHFIPYLKQAKAIVTDEGGLTCHAAIIAREFQIPCIVGTKNATSKLKNNQYISISPNGVINLKL